MKLEYQPFLKSAQNIWFEKEENIWHSFLNPKEKQPPPWIFVCNPSEICNALLQFFIYQEQWKIHTS
jgi:hypothetical protein